MRVFCISAVLFAAVFMGLAGAGCDSSPACPAGQTKCGDTCIDPSSDRANCGACGTVCTDGQVCQSGICTACQNECDAGTRQCAGAAAFQACTAGSDTCLIWGEATDCGENLICDGDGECVADCADQCDTVGEAVCEADGSGYRMCGEYDGDACLDLSSPIPCTSGYSCDQGTCVETCSDDCAQAEVQCSTDGYDTCGDFDADSCLEWGGHTVCPQGTSCSNGTCSDTCTDECNQGETLCDGNGYRSCGQYDADACFDWSFVTDCASYESCVDGACVVTCVDDCDLGETLCNGDGYDACGNYDVDPCLEWGGHVACPLGYVCDADINLCLEDCVDECAAAEQICDASGYRVCGDYDTDSCLEFSGVTPCGPGESCSNGVCSLTCTDECADGERDCLGNAFRACGNYDADPCLDWSSPTSCLAYEVCAAGACEVACSDECPALDDTRCATDGYDVCGNYDADPCREWGGHVACQQGYRCDAGACVEDCANECTIGERICDGQENGYRLCGDYDADSCLEFSSVVLCDMDETCSAGACSPNCSDECSAGETECFGAGWRQCGNYDADACLDWSSATSCLAYEICDPGTVTCVPNCADECVAAEQQCSGNGFLVCGNYDADPCLDWSGVNNCQIGWVCDPASNQCIEDCIDECPPGASQCDGDGYDQCGDYDTDSCLEWGGHTVCPGGTTCSNGVCEVTCSDECAFGGEQVCEGTLGFRVCGEYDADPCFDLGGVTYCAANEECQAGSCVVVCTDECVVGERRCMGTEAQICGQFDGDACLDWGAVMNCGAGTLCYRGQCISDSPTTVLVNEVLYDDLGTDGEQVFIEIWGPADLSLDNYSVLAINGNGGTVSAQIDLDGYVLPADGHFVIVDTNTTWVDYDLQAPQADLQNGPDSVQVVYGGALVLDAMGYGTFSASDVFAGEGNAAPEARFDNGLGTPYCLSRQADHTDTDDNLDDFMVRTYCSPGWEGFGLNLGSLGVGSTVTATPALDLASNRLFVASDSYLDVIYADSLSWDYWITIDGHKSSPALSADGSVVYLGHATGASAPGLHAYSTVDGTELWVAYPGTEVMSSPAVDPADGSIYFGTRGLGIQAVNADSSAKWNLPKASWVDSSPAIGPIGPAGESYVVIGVGGVGAGEVIAIDAATGVQVWSQATGGGCNGSPAIGSDGTVYASCDDGFLYAFAGSDGTAQGLFPVQIAVTGTDPLVGGCSPTVVQGGSGDSIFVTSRASDGNFFLFDNMGNELTGGYLGDSVSSVTVTADGGFTFIAQGYVFSYGPYFTLEWYGYLAGTDPTDWIVSSPLAAPSGIGTGLVYATSRAGRVNMFHGPAGLNDGAGNFPKFRGTLPNTGTRMP